MIHSDKRHLEAAEGWLGLGDWASANAELEEISPKMRAHPDVLLLRCEIYGRAGKWDYVVEVASTLAKELPKRRDAWIHRSFALHELKRTQEAFDQLLPAADLFPRYWLIPYNLACYCAQLGEIDESEKWFKRAMAIDQKTVQVNAIDDPDLEPRWEGKRGSVWKREE